MHSAPEHQHTPSLSSQLHTGQVLHSIMHQAGREGFQLEALCHTASDYMHKPSQDKALVTGDSPHAFGQGARSRLKPGPEISLLDANHIVIGGHAGERYEVASTIKTCPHTG